MQGAAGRQRRSDLGCGRCGKGAGLRDSHRACTALACGAGAAHTRHCTAGQRSGGVALASARARSLLLLVQAASKRGACGPEGGIAVGSHAKCWDNRLCSGSPAGLGAPQHEHVGANRGRPSLQACSLGADHAGGALQTCSSLLACWSGIRCAAPWHAPWQPSLQLDPTLGPRTPAPALAAGRVQYPDYPWIPLRGTASGSATGSIGARCDVHAAQQGHQCIKAADRCTASCASCSCRGHLTEPRS